MTGRYGPYVTDGEINATIPKAQLPEDVTLEQAVELLKRRAERIAAQGGPKTKRKRKAAKKKAPKRKKKAAAKTKPGRKKVAKKKASPKKKAVKKKAPGA
jgi:DNA topoisomerase-1